MNRFLAGLAGAAIASLAVAFEALAQTPACYTGDEYIPVEVVYRYQESEPAYIYAAELTANVNVRTGPGQRFAVNRTIAPGFYVDVIGQAFSADCWTWLYVTAPLHDWQGWVRADFLQLGLGDARGYWD